MDATTSADAYGEAFAAVYDEWYPSDARAEAVVAALGPPFGTPLGPPSDERRGDAGRVLELGVGTGVIALALARAGWQVTGVDSSPAMLAALTAKASAGAVHAILADAGAPDTWPPGRHDVVLAVWNLLTNLVDRDAQRALLRGAARALRPDGRLVVEAFVPLPPPRRERRVAAGVASTQPGANGPWVRVHTDADPNTSVVEGRHVELRDGTVVVRPWRVCWLGVAELDHLAGEQGLELAGRTEDWAGTEFVADQSPGHVSWYRLSQA